MRTFGEAAAVSAAVMPLASDPPLHSALHGITELATCVATPNMQIESDAT